MDQSTAEIKDTMESTDEIDLLELFLYGLDHWKRLVAGMLIGGLIAFVWTYWMVVPIYASTAKIYILSASSDSVVNLSDLQIGQQLTSDYQELILSRPLLESVIDEMELDMTTQQLANSITISNKGDTRIIDIKVSNEDPQLAADLANALAESAIDYLPEVMETSPPNIVETAVVPVQRESPSLVKNTFIGMLLGLMVTGAWTVVQFLLDDTITSPDQLEMYFNVQPLGIVPEAENYMSTQKTQDSSADRSKKRKWRWSAWMNSK